MLNVNRQMEYSAYFFINKYERCSKMESDDNSVNLIFNNSKLVASCIADGNDCYKLFRHQNHSKKPIVMKTDLTLSQVKYLKKYLSSLPKKDVKSVWKWEKVLHKIDRVSANSIMLKKGMIVKMWHYSHDNLNLKFPEYHKLYIVGAFKRNNVFELLPMKGGGSVKVASANDLLAVNYVKILEDAYVKFRKKYKNEYMNNSRSDYEKHKYIKMYEKYKMMSGNIYEVVKCDLSRHKYLIAVPKYVDNYEHIYIDTLDYVEKFEINKL